jgi:hypothetical protein
VPFSALVEKNVRFKMTEVAKDKKVVVKVVAKKVVKDKLNIKALIRNLAAGKVSDAAFTDTLTKFYKTAGRDDAWTKSRVNQLKKEAKPSQKKAEVKK